MKKKTLGLLAAILSVCMLAGCGAKDTGDGTGAATDAGTESTALKDMDVDKYVTLGEYKGLAVSVDTVEVDEDEWDTLVNNVYYGNITAENGGIMDRAVETGDTVNIDYEGKKDGVAFDGGTAQGYDLTIGSSGEKVRQLQQQLNRIARNYPAIPTLVPDGIYGPNTAEAVRMFQKIFHLPQTGIVDYPTWFEISDIYVGVTRISEPDV